MFACVAVVQADNDFVEADWDDDDGKADDEDGKVDDGRPAKHDAGVKTDEVQTENNNSRMYCKRHTAHTRSFLCPSRTLSLRTGMMRRTTMPMLRLLLHHLAGESQTLVSSQMRYSATPCSCVHQASNTHPCCHSCDVPLLSQDFAEADWDDEE